MISTRCIRTTLCAALVGFAGVAANGADEQYQREIDRAREVFKLIVDGKYEEFVLASTEEVREKLPADGLKQIWIGITGTVGAYVKEMKATAVPVRQWVAVDLVSQFESAALNVRVTLDGEGKVAGLLFLPTSEGVTYEAPEYADRSKFREETITVSAGEFPLPGTLTIPKGKGPFPAVVLVHGSGPHDEDETIFNTKPFKDLAWGLASRGVAVVRYEKRTHKYPDSIDPVKVTIDEETVDDAVAAVRLLLNRADIDSRRVFVAGHSLGATAAPYLATKERRMAGIIMLAAAARPIYELVEDQVRYIANVDGTIDEAEGEGIAAIVKEVQALREGTWKPGDTLLGAPAEYWAGLDKMDPIGHARALTIPILIVQGGRDYQVSMKDFGIWKKQLAGRKNVTLKLFERMDHLFHAADGPSTPQQYTEKGYVDESVIAYLADWIHRRH